MNTEVMERFTSMLALAALFGSILLWVIRLTALRVAALRPLLDAVSTLALWLAFTVAASATAGSLYFSEIANFTPCKLCWYQRIAMFPLTATLLVAAVRKDRGARWYVLPAAAVGLAISMYHYLIEWYPSLEKTSCALSAPCTAVWFRGFGFVSLAFMAGAGFFAIITLLTLREPNPSHNSSV